MKKILVSLLLLLALSSSSYATQNSLASGTFPTVSPYPGLTLVNNINSAFAASISNNSGATAPSYITADMFWGNTTNNTMQFYNGSTSSPIGSFNGTQWVVSSSGFTQLAITSTGSANAYVVTYSPAPTAYVTGQKYRFVTNFSNTGAATVNVNTLGALPLKKLGNVALISGDLGNGVVVECVYDSTNCEITSELSSANTINSGTTGNIAYYASTGTAISGTTALPNGTTATTQTAGDNTTKVATDAFTHGGLLNEFTVFTSSGTWTPATGTNSAIMFCVGGGGGGAGAGTSGSGAGGTGGTTTVGSLCSAVGGSGGAVSSGGLGSGGAGGTASGGVLNISGTAGGNVSATSGSIVATGGFGGPSFFGGGGLAGYLSDIGGNGATNSGGGGGGAGGQSASSNLSGAGGGSGGLSIGFATGLSGTQTVTIGAAGSAGTAGASGFAGGSGGTGVVFIMGFK